MRFGRFTVDEKEPDIIFLNKMIPQMNFGFELMDLDLQTEKICVFQILELLQMCFDFIVDDEFKVKGIVFHKAIAPQIYIVLGAKLEKLNYLFLHKRRWIANREARVRGTYSCFSVFGFSGS